MRRMLRPGSRVCALLPLLVVLGCMEPSRTDADPEIVTSFDALRHIVEPLAGDVAVHSLLPAGVSPHAYSPRPSEVAQLQNAALIVYAHANIDGWISTMSSSQGLALFANLPLESENHSAGDPHSGNSFHSDGDPHVWNDPVLVGKAIPSLSTALCNAFQGRCPAVRRRANVFSASLIALEDSLQTVAREWQANNPDACFITSQPFIDRFLERFGFNFVGPLSISPDVEPSPTSLSTLLQDAERRSCSSLVVQDALVNRLEHRLASERQWMVISVDPLGGSASSYGEYLASLMNALTANTMTSPPVAESNNP